MHMQREVDIYQTYGNKFMVPFSLWFENDGMCRAKSTCKNQTFTVQQKNYENRTLTVHFSLRNSTF